MNALGRWCDSVGILVDHRLQLQDVVDDELESEIGGYALVANSAIGAGELVAYIPEDCVLSRRTTSCVWRGEDELALALCVTYERQLGEASRFYSYLSSLPSISLPFSWKDTPESVWLAGTEAERIVRRAEHAWKNGTSAGFCLGRLKAYWDCEHAAAGLKAHLWSEFVQAFSLVLSRAFVLNEFHWYAPKLTSLAMVPIADLFNHSVTHNVQVESDPKDTHGIIVRSVEHIDTGEEALNSYGDLSNPELLCRYGFILDARTGWEKSSWDCAVPEECAEIAQVFGLAGALSPAPQCSQSLGDDDDEFAQVSARDKQRLFIDALGRPSWPLWQLALSVGGPSQDVRAASAAIVRLCEQRIARIYAATHEEGALAAMSRGRNSVQACALHALQESDMLRFCVNRYT